MKKKVSDAYGRKSIPNVMIGHGSGRLSADAHAGRVRDPRINKAVGNPDVMRAFVLTRGGRFATRQPAFDRRAMCADQAGSQKFREIGGNGEIRSSVDAMNTMAKGASK